MISPFATARSLWPCSHRAVDEALRGGQVAPGHGTAMSFWSGDLTGKRADRSLACPVRRLVPACTV